MKMSSSSSPDSDNLTLGDSVRCLGLIDTYRVLVESRDICGGDCPDDGASCPSGICRAHLRSSPISLLRRGLKGQHHRPTWNVWSIHPEDQIRLNSPDDRSALGRPHSANAVVRNLASPSRSIPPVSPSTSSSESPPPTRFREQHHQQLQSPPILSSPSRFSGSARGASERFFEESSSSSVLAQRPTGSMESLSRPERARMTMSR
jgi:hypothetical protein